MNLKINGVPVEQPDIATSSDGYLYMTSAGVPTLRPATTMAIVTKAATDASTAPVGGVGIHFNTATDSMAYWNGSAWVFIVGEAAP